MNGTKYKKFIHQEKGIQELKSENRDLRADMAKQICVLTWQKLKRENQDLRADMAKPGFAC